MQHEIGFAASARMSSNLPSCTGRVRRATDQRGGSVRRVIVTTSAVIALLIATSGCSFREVQLWFQVVKHTSITTDQATSVANAVNSKRAAGCDTRYSPGASYATQCVPNNVAAVHCAGTTGDGPAVRGPLLVTGFDAFLLDPLGLKTACVNPVGNLDLVGQVFDHVDVAGWAFDPNTTDPIGVNVYDNDVRVPAVTANLPRPDVASQFVGQGTNHGFDVSTDTAGQTGSQRICVDAINVGPGTGVNQSLSTNGPTSSLHCKTVVVQDIQERTLANGDTVFALLEGADRVAGGIRIRGFVVDDDAPTVPVTASVASSLAPASGEIVDVTSKSTVVRDDVVDGFDADGDTLPAGSVHGFDFVQPTNGSNGFTAATSQVCLLLPGVSVMCRALDS